MEILDFLTGQGLFAVLALAIIIIYVVNRIRSRRR